MQKPLVRRRIRPLIPYYMLGWAPLLGSGSSDHCACQQQFHSSHGALASDPYSCQQSPTHLCRSFMRARDGNIEKDPRKMGILTAGIRLRRDDGN